LKAACIEKHGKAPSVDPRAQPTDETAVLLGRAQDAEAAFIRTAMMAGMTAASVDAAFDDLASAIVGWANAATRGWVSAKQHAKRLEAEQSIREGGPGPIGGPADVWGPR
jgi:hypothetical protein